MVRLNDNSGNVNELNKIAAGEDRYIKINLGIKNYDEETENIISSTFGVIKNNILEAFWYSVGFHDNVNGAYTQVMQDPNAGFELQGKVYYQYPGVGTLTKYNEAGYPSGGCFSLHEMA